jgi:hypothetical protein
MASFNALDWVALGLALLAAFGPAVWSLVGLPNFALLLGDFGPREGLPTLTRLALNVWFGPGVSVVAASPIAVACYLKGQERLPLARRLVGLSFAAGGVGLAGFWYAMYLPIWKLAQPIPVP